MSTNDNFKKNPSFYYALSDFGGFFKTAVDSIWADVYDSDIYQEMVKQDVPPSLYAQVEQDVLLGMECLDNCIGAAWCWNKLKSEKRIVYCPYAYLKDYHYPEWLMENLVSYATKKYKDDIEHVWNKNKWHMKKRPKEQFDDMSYFYEYLMIKYWGIGCVPLPPEVIAKELECDAKYVKTALSIIAYHLINYDRCYSILLNHCRRKKVELD